MKRINKKIIMSFVMAGIIGTIVVTSTFATTTTNTKQTNETMEQKASGNLPQGSASQGTPPSKPSGNGQGNPQGAGSTSTNVKTIGVYTQNSGTINKSKTTIASTVADKSTIKVTNGILNLSNSKLIKTGNTSSEDNSNFYGLNAAILAETAGKINIKNCTITTNADGANAVFATGSNATVTISNVNINTTANSSRGLDATLSNVQTITSTNLLH